MISSSSSRSRPRSSRLRKQIRVFARHQVHRLVVVVDVEDVVNQIHRSAFQMQGIHTGYFRFNLSILCLETFTSGDAQEHRNTIGRNEYLFALCSHTGRYDHRHQATIVGSQLLSSTSVCNIVSLWNEASLNVLIKENGAHIGEGLSNERMFLPPWLK